MEDWEKEYKELEEKYYPITWEIAKGEIQIHCKDGKLLPRRSRVVLHRGELYQRSNQGLRHFYGRNMWHLI